MSSKVVTVEWRDGAVRLIDQTLLPTAEVYLDCRDVETLAEAIEVLRVRGAPAIGVAAAYGVALAARVSTATDLAGLRADLAAAVARLARTRPTAVNLFWALQLQTSLSDAWPGSPNGLRAALLARAEQIREDDLAAGAALAQHGATLIPAEARILTHCNAGALATSGGYGTALAVIRGAAEQGKVAMVYADETRPLLQGARLTAWELATDGLPVTLLCDNMAGFLMQRGGIDCVVVGADRITANGDVANKIGTYSVAVLARHHGLPLYVAAPVSTLDLSLASGAEIPIEERRPEEVTSFAGVPTAPAGIAVYNPAFDVTPHDLVTAIVTELGVVRPPYRENLARLQSV
ncbi:MAG: S-methyl-5-thioribose-1-phosphate isomerase [Fimbriimonadaceae bacterium]|nr:S-methyl-5-thioribose-1-phosphate isomerase [Fimbriimonadaceae bacterium]